MPRTKKELINMRKATWRNLSKSRDRRSWEHSTKKDKIKTHGCHATNDQLEGNLIGTTRGIELGGMLNIPQAAAQSDARRNNFWNRKITARRGKKKTFKVKGTAQEKMDNRRTLAKISVDCNYSPTCTEYQGVEIWVEIFLCISWYNLKVLSPAKLLVDKSMLTMG